MSKVNTLFRFDIGAFKGSASLNEVPDGYEEAEADARLIVLVQVNDLPQAGV